MYTQIILIIVIFLNTTLAIFVLSQNSKEQSNRLFSMLGFFGALWTFSHYMINVSQEVFWFNNIFAFGSLVISAGLMWTIVITEKNIRFLQASLISIIALIFFIASLIPGFILKLPLEKHLTDIPINNYGLGLYLFSIYYLIFAYLIIWKLYKAKKHSKSLAENSQFKIILIGALISLAASGTTTFIIPMNEVSLSGIIDGIGFLIFLTSIAYSITRHQLFSIRVIAIELVTFGLWTITLVRTITADTIRETLTECGILITMLIFGVMLIKSTLHEISQREHIEKLADDVQKAYASVKDLNENLENKVAEQTKDVKRAYEVEKQSHQELEKLDETKNQLITAAQHNLRTPLTALRWQLEEIRKSVGGNGGGDVKDVKNGLQEALKESEVSVGKLTEVLEDFLKITEMRVGGKDQN